MCTRAPWPLLTLLTIIGRGHSRNRACTATSLALDGQASNDDACSPEGIHIQLRAHVVCLRLLLQVRAVHQCALCQEVGQ